VILHTVIQDTLSNVLNIVILIRMTQYTVCESLNLVIYYVKLISVKKILRRCNKYD